MIGVLVGAVATGLTLAVCGLAAAAGPEMTPSPTAACGSHHVLIAYTDTGVPTALRTEILAEPGVAAVDLFDAGAGTPTLAQLQQHDIVVPYSNNPFADGVALGNNLADYVDGGGIAVQYGFSFYGPAQTYGVNGRWVTGNYNVYNYSTSLAFSAFTLGTHNSTHPLMAGVTALNSDFQNVVTLATGATQVAAASNGNPLVAFRPVSGGHTTIGVTGYVGASATQSGDWGRVIVNAANWLCSRTLTVAKAGSGAGTVTSSPAGIDCGSTCSALFGNGTQVTLSAPPAPGSVFTGWSGAGCSGAGLCTTAMSSDQSVTANFVAHRTLSVSKSGSGSGSVTSSPAGIDCGATCSASYDDGTPVTLTATPDAGSTFTGLSGGGCSGTGTCVVTLSGDQAVSAGFDVIPPPPPNTKIKKAKINQDKDSAKFKFKAIGAPKAAAATSGFQCQLKRKGKEAKKFKNCTSPKTYKHLKPGKYTFKVRAFSAAGKDPTPAKKKFKIK
jgi:hypothetical protein